MRFVTDTYDTDGRNGLCVQKYSRFKLHIKTSYYTILQQWNCNDNDHGFAYVDDHIIYPVIQHIVIFYGSTFEIKFTIIR